MKKARVTILANGTAPLVFTIEHKRMTIAREATGVQLTFYQADGSPPTDILVIANNHSYLLEQTE